MCLVQPIDVEIGSKKTKIKFNNYEPHYSLNVGKNFCLSNVLAFTLSIVLFQNKFIIIGDCFPN
jgi:hypothetical protein